MEHIRHLKRHRNILYGIVVLLLVIQIVSLVVFVSQVSQLRASQETINKELTENLDDFRSESQYKTNELTKELTKQRIDFQQAIALQQNDFSQQIEVLKASQQDFSGIIENVIKGVVSVGTDKSAGTGFIVHSSGYVVTNNHVIQGGQYVKILTYNDKIYDAQVIGTDPVADLALLKVNGVFDHLSLGNSSNVSVGEKVIAIGNPLGLSFTVTSGIVSALHRVGSNGLATYIQTDVTLNPGNSGGPLIDTKGKVIGINNFKIGSAEGLGFALESNVIKKVVNSLANKTIIE